MGLVAGEWLFRSGSAPSIEEVAEGLRGSMRLEVTHKGVGKDATLSITALGESLFDWNVEPNRLTVHGFIPAHPYLWEHLDAVLGAAGGKTSEAEHAWKPDPKLASLRRPWTELTTRQRFLLRLPTIAASRPLDRLLPKLYQT